MRVASFDTGVDGAREGGESVGEGGEVSAFGHQAKQVGMVGVVNDPTVVELFDVVVAMTDTVFVSDFDRVINTGHEPVVIATLRQNRECLL